jgi:hypothetical protein
MGHRSSGSSSWLSDKLAVGKSAIHGKGVFATKRVTAGERLAIFGGDVMAIDEIDDLPSRRRDSTAKLEIPGGHNWPCSDAFSLVRAFLALLKEIPSRLSP